MNRPVKLPISLFALGLGAATLISACNSGDSGSDPGPDPVGSIPETSITSDIEANKAAASVLGDLTLQNAIDQGDFSSALGAFRTAARLKGPAIPEFSVPGAAGESLARIGRQLLPVARQVKSVSAKLDGAIEPQAVTEEPCDSGTMTTTDTTMGAIVTYNNCRWNYPDSSYELINGTVSFTLSSYTDTSATYSMKTGDGDDVVEAGDLVTILDDGLGNVVSLTSSVQATVHYSYDPVTMDMDISYTSNGVVREDDGVEVKDFHYSNYRVDFAFTENLMDMDVFIDGILNVEIDLVSTGAGVDSTSFIGFDNYIYTYTVDPLDATIDYVTQNGKIVYTNDPMECEDGSYTVQTQLAFKRESGVLTEGLMTINNTVTIEVTGPNTIRVTIGGVFTDYTESELFSICLI